MKLRGFEVISDWQDKDVHLPQRQTGASAGYDIEAAADCVIPAGGMVLVPTGLKAYMQVGEVLTLNIRSSMAVKHQLLLSNSVGIIDADYYDNPDNEGHIMIKFTNASNTGLTISLKAGDAFAQGIFTEYGITFDDDCTEVRNGGFGSTSK